MMDSRVRSWPGSRRAVTLAFMRPHSAALWLALGALACDATPDVRLDPDAHAADVEAWRQYRYNLLAEEGWLLLVGLEWLEPGDNTFGAAPDNDVVLAGEGVPRRVGVLRVQDSTVTMRVEAGRGVKHGDSLVTEIVMQPGSWASGTVATLGSLNWHVIRRGGAFALRVRDSLTPSFTEFDSIPAFPLNPAWRLAARFDRYNPPDTIRVPSILGTVNDTPSPGAAVFRVDGRTYRLDVLGDPADSSFWIQFGDETNAIDTYGGGRYIWIDVPPGRDEFVIDFNKSYNPPCVFTAFATCPLPPRQNRLPLRIEAGERSYGFL